jgi:hypothetical protein
MLRIFKQTAVGCALGVLLGVVMLSFSGCQGSSQAEQTVITPPAQLPVEVAESAMQAARQTQPSGGIRKRYSAIERMRIRHATINVPD